MGGGGATHTLSRLRVIYGGGGGPTHTLSRLRVIYGGGHTHPV